jgi:Zn-finger nucleic acid-binding protein
MRCPRCRKEGMQAIEVPSGARLHGCGGCGGHFLDYGELADAAATPLLVEQDGRPGAVDDSVALDCPRCAVALVKHPVPGAAFAVDRCGRCGGTFLDRGELAALATSAFQADLERLFRPPPKVQPQAVKAGLTTEERVVLARAADLAARSPEAAAFLRQKLGIA